MNRHRKFYSTLDENLNEDYYDEYEDDDYDDDYYEGNVLQYVLGGRNASPPAQALPHDGKGPVAHVQPAEVHTLDPNDADYSLIIEIMPQLQEKWAELNSGKKSKGELAQTCAVESLRECNYEVDEAALYALRKAGEMHLGSEEQTSLQPSKAQSNISTGGTKAALAAPFSPPSHRGRTLKLGEGNKAVKKITEETKPLMTKGSSSNVKPLKKENKVLEVLPDPKRQDCTFIIAGHVDAGKSTTLGHLLLLLGKVSQAEVDKNEKDARQLNKVSFKYAWLLDQSEEERRRGVTIDAGSHCFETSNRRIHILDAPGHKDYVLNMISSATQADAALLVVTAAPSEFEVGLAHGTRDHLVVLKTLGVGHVVVAVNKMDKVDFSEERYNYVVQEIKSLMKRTRYKEDAVVGFCPVSGMQGTNICVLDREATPWYDGPSLVELLDRCPLESRLLNAPLRLSLQDVQGTELFCKVESGKLQKGDKLVFVPSDVKVHVRSIDKPTVGGSVDVAFAGDTVVIDTSSSLVGLRPGCVGCCSTAPLLGSTDFKARVQTFTTLEKSILPGAVFTMVAHALTVQVQVISLVSKMDRKGEWSKGMVKCIPKATQALILFRADGKVALEPAVTCRSLGRFVLQQDGETVAGGLVEKVIL